MVARHIHANRRSPLPRLPHAAAGTIAVPATVPMPRITDTSTICPSLRHLLVPPAMLSSFVVLTTTSVASTRRFAAVEWTQRTNALVPRCLKRVSRTGETDSGHGGDDEYVPTGLTRFTSRCSRCGTTRSRRGLAPTSRSAFGRSTRCFGKDAELWRLLNYYEGQQPLSYMHPELLATLDDRVRQLVVNWSRQVVDALEERIDLEGFRLSGQSAIDEDLDHIW
jgi:hypothetical protein